MTSGLQGLAIVAGVIFVTWLVLLAVGAILSWIGSEWRAAKNTEDRLGVVFATLAGCMLTPLGAYALWLWVSGAENPLREAVFSPLGYAWLGLLLILMAGYALVGAKNGILWLSEHSSEVPGIVGHRLRLLWWGYFEFLGGPVTFPIREWRNRSEAGAGTAAKVASSAFVTVIGLIVSMMTASLTVLAGYGVLSTFGIVG
ncbi:MAG: hypothetical protein E5X61_32315 [Mesorhizobium sp.]|nr:MAG: hypothetical protein E5X61_32315 [Mesorhizobium sp.]